MLMVRYKVLPDHDDLAVHPVNKTSMARHERIEVFLAVSPEKRSRDEIS
jgi:hypothetical protein